MLEELQLAAQIRSSQSFQKRSTVYGFDLHRYLHVYRRMAVYCYATSAVYPHRQDLKIYPLLRRLSVHNLEWHAHLIAPPSMILIQCLLVALHVLAVYRTP